MKVHWILGRGLILACGWILACGLPTARAQGPAPIEDLFRSIIESQLQRNDPRRPAGGLPPTTIPGGPITGPGPVRPSLRPDGIALEQVRSETAELARQTGDLVQEVRRLPSVATGRRDLRGSVFRLQALADALARQAAGSDDFTTLQAPLREWLEDWQTVAFRLRQSSIVSATVLNLVGSIDHTAERLGRHLGVQTTLDRAGLREQLILAGAHIQDLLDDLQLANLPQGRRRQLLHDGRILHQQLQRDQQHALTASIDEIMPRYHDFTTKWRSYATQLLPLGDPHIEMRLQRIREAGDEVAALLYLPPASDGSYRAHQVQQLQQEVTRLLNQLTVQALFQLPLARQAALLETAGRLDETCRRWADDLARGRPLDSANSKSRFRQITDDWNQLLPTLRALERVDAGLLSRIDLRIQELRSILQVEAPFNYQRAVQLAAALEGQASSFAADLSRYRNYLQPAEYRDRVLRRNDQFEQLARQFNTQLTDRRDAPGLRQRARKLLTQWQLLSADLQDLSAHGLIPSRAGRLQRSARELDPILAELSAMFLSDPSR